MLPTKLPFTLLVPLLLVYTHLGAAAPTSVLQIRQSENESSASPRGSLAEFTRPREGDTLVTGSVAEVRWETQEWDGTVMLEVANGQRERTNFVYVDYDIDYALGEYNWTIPETFEPGPYALRLANSSDPSIFADSPVFQVIHAAPPPESTPELPDREPGSLSREDIIGLGIGLGIAAALGLCVLWVWWRRRVGRGGPGRRRRPSRPPQNNRVDPATEGGIKDEDKLPEGVVSAWGPEDTTAPIELPAEESGRSDDVQNRSEGVEGRLELSGRAEDIDPRGQNEDSGTNGVDTRIGDTQE